ncbi:Uncharacterised protein [uncultured archaeon]|nr:Uncharacterised protein [uncultured archaeon]
MNLAKLVAGAVLSAAFLGGCVTDNYVRQTNDSYKQYYQGFPPKFMQDPFHNIKVPTYDQMKFKR